LILYPLAPLFGAAKALETIYEKLRRDGNTVGMEERMMNFGTFNELIGVEEKYRLAARFHVE
jgi:2-methylisocitrate lyase-like PEP mutase family enzyme